MMYHLEVLTKQDIEKIIDETSPPERLESAMWDLIKPPPHEPACRAINKTGDSYLLRYAQAPQDGPHQMIFVKDGQLHHLSVDSMCQPRRVVNLDSRYANEWASEELMLYLDDALHVHGTEGSMKYADHPVFQISDPTYHIRRGK
jgi:hypothetical protein